MPHREAVELRLGQRVGALVLDRVLGRHDHERPRRARSVTPSTVTWFSCMHSSSADCVFGDARLISSTSSRFVKTGPRPEARTRSTRWSKTLTPVTSEGSRSGVNCRRENEQSTERASAFASIVFPTPGKSSMIRCPSATRQSTRGGASPRARARRGRRWRRLRRAASAAPRRRARLGSRASIQQPLDLVEHRRRDLGLRRLAAPRRRPSRETMHHLVLLAVEPDVRPATRRCRRRRSSVLARRACRAARSSPSLARARRRSRPAPARSCGARRARGGRRWWARARAPRPRRPSAACPRARLGRPVVGDGGGHDHHVRVGAGERLALDVRRGRRLRRASTPAGAGTARFAASSVTSAPRRRASSASATPIRPGRAVADEADGVDRLARPAGADEHPLPDERGCPPTERAARDAREDLLRLGHPPDARTRPRRARPPRGRRARRRARAAARRSPAWPGAPTCATFIAGRDDERPAVRERRLGQDVVGEPVRELRERVRRERRDDEQVGARQMRVGVGRRPAAARARGRSRR